MALVNHTHTATATRSSLTRPSSTDNISGTNVEITNVGAVPVIVGGSTVTAANGGTSIPPNGSWYLDNAGATDTIHVITASGTADLNILWTAV